MPRPNKLIEIEKQFGNEGYEYFSEKYKYDPNTGHIFKNYGSYKRVGYITNKGYEQVYDCGRTYKVHRIAWLLTYKKWPDYQIDHINGNKADNRIENLRDVTMRENSLNRPEHRENGEIGFRFDKRRGDYSSRILFNGQDVYLGAFKSKEGAVASKVGATKIAVLADKEIATLKVEIERLKNESK